MIAAVYADLTTRRQREQLAEYLKVRQRPSRLMSAEPSSKSAASCRAEWFR